jgi:hypothetical protein
LPAWRAAWRISHAWKVFKPAKVKEQTCAFPALPGWEGRRLLKDQLNPTSSEGSFGWFKKTDIQWVMR